MKPIGDVIIVRQHEEGSIQSSMIIIPDAANRKAFTGEVVYSGDKATSKPGDVVSFDKWAFTKFRLNDEELLILKEVNVGVILRNNTKQL